MLGLLYVGTSLLISALLTVETVIAPTELELASALLALEYDREAKLGALGADADMLKSAFIKVLNLLLKDLIAP